MSRHVTLAVKCLQLAFISTLVNARIVPNYYTSSDDKTENFNQLTAETSTQTENKFKWPLSTLNSQQSNELEKLVKQSLENIFKNEELANNNGVNIGGYGFKKLPKQSETADFTSEKVTLDEDDLSSSHILKVPVPQPYPVHIPVKQPFTVPIFKLVPEEVEKRVPIPVEKLVPIYKEKPVKFIVEKHHPYPVYKPYAVPVPVNTHILLGKKKEQQKWTDFY